MDKLLNFCSTIYLYRGAISDTYAHVWE